MDLEREKDRSPKGVKHPEETGGLCCYHNGTIPLVILIPPHLFLSATSLFHFRVQISSCSHVLFEISSTSLFIAMENVTRTQNEKSRRVASMVTIGRKMEKWWWFEKAEWTCGRVGDELETSNVKLEDK
ncbi:hypothetical protein PIB30_062282 [Stylosanthes scabra]|uniref:Uncharacterized protein n=1 Tax=Stylosanthes scabra TaxID=79078 RepID=A0ABU6SMX4_9FABA|nr:hypothetical protein [Stylosanthes scabra]